MKFKVPILFFLICLSCLSLFSLSYANEKSAIVLSEEVIVTADSLSTFDEIEHFFTNLDKYYLDLSKDHKKFILMNSKILKPGIYIENEESAGGQFLKHKYLVQEFKIDRDQKAIKLIMISPKSQVNTMGMTMEVKVTLSMNVAKICSNEYKISAILDIEFKNWFDLFLANLANTKGIWEKHFRDELKNGRNIIVNHIIR